MLFFPENKMFFRFLVLIQACTAFPFQCPNTAQWSIRARGLCHNPSKYSCLKNDLINGYSENCTISDFQAPGRKGVLRGGLDADICSQERYHPWPIKYYTNISTNCIFLKSVCNEEGQVIYGKGNRNTDITCRCDYTRGYDFIGKPRNPCYCVPSEEDCSCYLKACIDQTYFLSPDKECIHTKMNTTTANCTAIYKESVSKEQNDSNTTDTKITEHILTPVQRKLYSRLIVIAFCIGFILVYCLYELMEKSSCKGTTLVKISHTAEEKDVEHNIHKADEIKLAYIFDKETPKIQIEESEKKDFDLLATQALEVYDQQNSDRIKVPDWMTKVFEEHEIKEKKYFVNTTAIKCVMNCIHLHECVSVIGPSGVGKTFLVYHVALEMEKIGYTILKVDSPKQIKKHYILDNKILFVVDDMCGNYTANKEKLEEWKSSMNDITKILDKKMCKLILTCRLQVFQDEEFKHSKLKLFHECICNLVDKKHALTFSEKQQLAKMYFKNPADEKLKPIFQYDFFPVLCQLYDRRDISNFSEDEFLKDPFAFYKVELDDLFYECKYKFVALLLLVLYNNHLEEKVFKMKEDQVISILGYILEKCPIKQFCIFELKNDLEVLTQTFVVNDNGTYHTLHDKLFDFLAFYFGKRYNQLIIKHANMDFINARCVIIDKDDSHKTTREEYVIAIEDDNLQLYTERVFNDMKKDENKWRLLFSNRNKYHEIFQITLCAIIKNLKKEEILNLIETSSSEFVRVMFVMDVTDIKLDSIALDERFGIVLEKVHLEKYTERMFVDMTKSDDVKNYMKRCRCCKNETFIDYLLTYMKSLRSTKIKELIKSASTSFVQLIFVLEKDDIKLRTPYVYKRYGIVLPNDVIQVYKERVFDDISESEDVNRYMKRNRNKANAKFQTRLLDYMTHLDLTTIEQLIKKASASFIYELCVMTTDDIDTISYNECQRYGVIIPDKCIQMYIDRWFDEMTKSYNISTYFVGNRNKQTSKFKTALLTYIRELHDENIEKLIKTASDDCLHKMFVTTKEDIKHDSSREFEHYGIVLQDKHLDIYTERILHLNNSIENIKCNRTILRVFKYMKQFDESRVNELIHASNTNVFHQMITVDLDNESQLDKMCQDNQCPYSIVENMLEMTEGPINCPVSLITPYMDRMISDWSNGKVYAVLKNKNLKKQYFVDKFLDHLNLLESSTISKLVNCENDPLKYTTFGMSCVEGELNLAEWCLEKHVYGNRGQKHNRLFALFLLVIYNNQLEETIISDELIKMTDVKFSFRKGLNIREDISARQVKGELNIFFKRIGVEKKGVNYSARYDNRFAFFVFYFASIQHMSNVLVEYADEKILFDWFLAKTSVSDQHQFNILLPDEELFTCIYRVFTKMTNSEEFMRYILEGDNKTNVNSLIVFVGKLNKKEIITIVEKSCVAFLITICAVTAKETQDHSDGDSELYIVIPDEYIPIYIKRIFDYLAKCDCVEECLHGNRNKRNKTFHSKLLIHMNELNRDEVEKLIRQASSDFINRIIVISEDDIKPQSCWEYERYGIVIPEDLLQIYMERVFSDMTKSVYVPVNRNSENKAFHDNLHLYINSLSEDEIASLIQTAGSKFISRINLSLSGETTYTSLRRLESSFMFLPKKYFQFFKQMLIVKGKMFRCLCSSIYTIKNDPTSYTIITHDNGDFDPVLIEIIRQNGIENSTLKQHLIGYNDPLLTSKIIACRVKSTKGLVSKYIQRLLDDWSNGHVHDVFGNINLSNQSFQCEFITHLRNLDHKKQSTLARTEDTNTKHFPLEVCCYVGISELAKWCLDDNINTNSTRHCRHNSLHIACVQNHPEIVSLLLNHTNKADLNYCPFRLPLGSPLCAACVGGNKTIVLFLLEEDVDVNLGYFKTPLYIACESGYYEIVSLLLDKKADEIQINKLPKVRFKGRTPLYVACKKGHTKIVSLLLNHTADTIDVKKDTYKGETPLFAACKGGYKDIVDLLLARDVRVINKSKTDGTSPLFVACQNSHVEVVSTLLKHKTIEKDQCMLNGLSPLCIASLLGHTEIVKMLLEKKADASKCVKNKEIAMQVFEIFEIEPKNYIKFIKKLVFEHASEDVQSYIDEKEEGWVFNSILGASPLHMGCLMGHTEIVKLLVDSNSNINSFSENGSTPLILAYELGHVDTVQVLLANGADPL